MKRKVWRKRCCPVRGGTPVLFALALCALFALVLMPVPEACASEGGGSHYAGGNEDFMAGALPPPGFYLINYFLNYNAPKLADSSGKAVRNIGFQADVVAEAPRILHVTNVKLLGGNLVWHAVPTLMYQHVTAGGQSQSKYGLGDLNFGVGISWHGKTLHSVGAIDGYAPIGNYDKSDVSNLGRNYWSVQPVWGITYLGDKDSPIPGFETSVKLMYMFNTTNTATGYYSGQEFSLDYLVGQHIGKWAFGANGHFFYQTENDTMRNETADFDGYKGRKFSIGPAVQYLVGKGAITAKVQFDVYTRNKAEGTGVWLKFFYPF